MIPATVTIIRDYAFSCSRLSGITLPERLASIPSGLFESCENLTSITIPESVNSIGYMPFQGCTSLEKIQVDENNQAYASSEGVLYNKGMTALIVYPAGKNGSYTIPATVTSVGSDAFSECSGLTELTIPAGMTELDELAFYQCNNLTFRIYPTQYLLDYAKSKSIPYQVYADCMMIIPQGTSHIETEAFAGSGCEVVIIPDGIQSIGARAFADCPNLVYVNMPVGFDGFDISMFSEEVYIDYRD